MRFLKIGLMMVVAVLFFIEPALAEEAAEQAVKSQWTAVAGAVGIALAAVGGAIGQGKTASSALEAIGRNPGASGNLFTPMILGLVFIESLVIYALIIAFKVV